MFNEQETKNATDDNIQIFRGNNIRFTNINDSLIGFSIDLIRLIEEYDYTIEGKLVSEFYDEKYMDIISMIPYSNSRHIDQTFLEIRNILKFPIDSESWITIIDNNIFIGHPRLIEIYDRNTLEKLTDINIVYDYYDIFDTSDKSIVKIVTCIQDGNISIFEYDGKNIKRINFKSKNHIKSLSIISNDKFMTLSTSNYEEEDEEDSSRYDMIEIYKYDGIKISSENFIFDKVIDNPIGTSIDITYYSISDEGIYFWGSTGAYLFDGGYIVLFNPNTMKIVNYFHIDDAIRHFVCLENNKLMYFSEYYVKIFDFSMGLEEVILGYPYKSTKYAKLPDGEISVISDNKDIIIYNPTTKDIQTIKILNDIDRIISTPDKRIAVSLSNNKIQIYR